MSATAPSAGKIRIAVTQKIATGERAYPTSPMNAADTTLPADSNWRFLPRRFPSSLRPTIPSESATTVGPIRLVEAP